MRPCPSFMIVITLVYSSAAEAALLSRGLA
jgi:hypothetical protein